ncbi:hypothetical protein HDV03_003376 [Kappamyces sp. JEL0829]|nr:hypothetical protein HDV03_003376 [Kappamyces sp. JEL0829]
MSVSSDSSSSRANALARSDRPTLSGKLPSRSSSLEGSYTERSSREQPLGPVPGSKTKQLRVLLEETEKTPLLAGYKGQPCTTSTGQIQLQILLESLEHPDPPHSAKSLLDEMDSVLRDFV